MDPERKEKLREAVAEILSSVEGRTLNIVVLNKALFYLDLIALRDFGKTVTDNTYIALKLGPVIAKYDKRIIEDLAKIGVIKQTEEENGAKPITLLKKTNSDHLTQAEIDLAHNIGKSFAENITSSEASFFSHDNEGWKLAFAIGLGAGKPAHFIDMGIALQQVIDDDPWMNEPVEAEILGKVCQPSAESEEW